MVPAMSPPTQLIPVEVEIVTPTTFDPLASIVIAGFQLRLLIVISG